MPEMQALWLQVCGELSAGPRGQTPQISSAATIVPLLVLLSSVAGTRSRQHSAFVMLSLMLTASLALHVRPRAGLVCAQLDPSRLELGRGGLYTPPPTPVPPIAVLADKQQLATLLASNWAEAAGSTGGFSGDTVEVGPSAVHGLGLIARRDLEEGTVVTLYPVHRVLQSLGDGRGAACLADEEGDDYFRPSKPISDEEMAYRQTAYRQT